MSGESATDFIRSLVAAWDCCATCAGGVLARRDAPLLDRLQAAEAALERVRALGDACAWMNFNYGDDDPVTASQAAKAIRDALAAPLSASGADGDHGGRRDGEGPCHCGQPIVWHDYQQPPVTRGLCVACDDVRCDAYPGACKR